MIVTAGMKPIDQVLIMTFARTHSYSFILKIVPITLVYLCNIHHLYLHANHTPLEYFAKSKNYSNSMINVFSVIFL